MNKRGSWRGLSCATILLSVVILPACRITIRNPLSEPVVISSDGLKLHARLYGPMEKPRGFIVLCHGNRPQGTSHDLYRSLARLLAEEYTVLALDFRGYGESEKPGREHATVNFTADVISAVHYMSERFRIPAKEVTLIGHSLGSLKVLNAGRALDSRTIVAVGVGDVREIVLESREKQEKYIEKLYRHTGMRVSHDKLSAAMEPLLLDRLLAGCPFRRVLFAFGDAERSNTAMLADYITRYHAACGQGAMDIAIISNADHMFATEPKGRGVRRLIAKAQKILLANGAVVKLSLAVRAFLERSSALQM